MPKHMKKTYPNDGPPYHIQELRLKPKRSAEENEKIRAWVRSYKGRKGARAETVAAYTV